MTSILLQLLTLSFVFLHLGAALSETTSAVADLKYDYDQYTQQSLDVKNSFADMRLDKTISDASSNNFQTLESSSYQSNDAEAPSSSIASTTSVQSPPPSSLPPDLVSDIYDSSSKRWLLNATVLQLIDSDVQAVVESASTGDTILFDLSQGIGDIGLPRGIEIEVAELTIGISTSSIHAKGKKSSPQVVFTCPPAGPLLSVRVSQFHISDAVFTGCKNGGDIIVIQSEYCESAPADEGTIFENVEIRENVVYSGSYIISAQQHLCGTLAIMGGKFEKNQCDGVACVALGSSFNTLQSIDVNKNSAKMDVTNHGFFYGSSGSRISIVNMTATGNKMRVISVEEGKSLQLVESNFQKNKIKMEGIHGGAAIYVSQTSSVNITDCAFNGNLAPSGGAIFASNSHITCMSVQFLKNEASDGNGGVFLTDGGTLAMVEVEMVENAASGSGAAIYGIGTEISVQFGFFANNSATYNGGVMSLYESKLNVKSTYMVNNLASDGNGGAISAENITQIVGREFIVVLNKARKNGGGIYIGLMSTFLCYQCSIAQNSAKMGGAISVDASNDRDVVLQLQRNDIENNEASKNGGGIRYNTLSQSHEDISPFSSYPSHILLLNTTFTNNTAGQHGGAIFTDNTNAILLDCSSKEEIYEDFLDQKEWKKIPMAQPSNICQSWNNNVAQSFEEESALGSSPNEIVLSTTPINGPLIKKDHQGRYILGTITTGNRFPTIYVAVGDGYDQGPYAPPKGAGNKVHVNTSSGFFDGTISIVLFKGVGNFTFVNGQYMPPKVYSVLFFTSDGGLKSRHLSVEIEGCRAIDGPNSTERFCDSCDTMQYVEDLAREGKCLPCPKHAVCNGRTFVPQSGYWHGILCQTRLKKCLNHHACHYRHREQILTTTSLNSDTCDVDENEMKTYAGALCHEGYEGKLCGSCNKKHGLTLGFKCTECPQKILSVVLLFVVVIYLFVVVASFVSSQLPVDWRSKRRLEASPSIVSPAVSPNVTQAEVAAATSMRSDVSIEHPLSLNVDVVDGPSYAIEKHYEHTRWKTTECFKILINFLQMTSLAATINIPWTRGVLILFETMQYIGLMSTAALSKPVDCLANSGSEAVRTIGRLIFKICVPSALLICCGAYWALICLRRIQGGILFGKRFLLAATTVVYLAYQGVTFIAIRIFDCVKIYDGEEPISNSKDEYWSVDTAIKCYGKEHSTLVAFSVILLLVVTIGCPLTLVLCILLNKKDYGQQDSWVCESIGFLYRGYKKEFVLWELLVFARKITMAIVVSFSYDMGGQVQGLLALLILTFFLFLTMRCVPFSRDFAYHNYLESLSLFISCVTLAFGLLFNSEKCSELARIIIAFIIIAVNFYCFVILFANFVYNWVRHCRVAFKVENTSVSSRQALWASSARYFGSSKIFERMRSRN